jgi:hypothetical protein
VRQARRLPGHSTASDVRALAAARADAGSYADALALATTAAEDLAATAPFDAALLLADAAWYAYSAHGPARALQLARQGLRLGNGAAGEVELVLRSRLGDTLQWNGRYREARRQWLRAAAAAFPR